MRRRHAIIIMIDEDADTELTAGDRQALRGRAAAAFPEAERITVAPAGWASTDSEPAEEPAARGFIT